MLSGDPETCGVGSLPARVAADQFALSIGSVE